MEPYWDFIRIDQVFGRAIRMGSHEHPDLLPSERYVEQYLYISTLPEGTTTEEIFASMKELEWPEVSEIEDTPDLVNKLATSYKNVNKTIQKIISIKKETQNRTADQILVDIMEKKYKVNTSVLDIIKEASVDCIQNTRDDLALNNKCLRFSSKIMNEEAYFPGINSQELNQIDKKQFSSSFSIFQEPNIFIISAQEGDNGIFIYYKMPTNEKNVDIRYIKENGTRICDFYPLQNVFSVYESASFPFNKLLGARFSVTNSLFLLTDSSEINIDEKIFPTYEEIRQKNLFGYIIKYNISERLFFSPFSKTSLLRLYDYKTFVQNNFVVDDNMTKIIIKLTPNDQENKVFISSM
jgi:hypothetical protein